MRFQKIRICLKELSYEPLESNGIDVRVRVKEFEIDLDVALLSKFQRATSKPKKKQTTVSDSLSPPSSSPCLRFDIVDTVYECHGQAGRRVRLGSSEQVETGELGRDGDV